MEAYEEKRWVSVFQQCVDVSRGTLWVVKDILWQQVTPDFVVKRKGHPGLSLGRGEREFVSLQDTVPMLIGTTKNTRRCGKDGFPVVGVRKDQGRTTYFCLVRPCKMTDWGCFSQVPVGEILGRNPLIEQNSYKPRLSAEELRQFNDYLGDLA